MLMRLSQQNLGSVTIYPYFPGVVCEMSPVIQGARAILQTGSLLGSTCCQLVLEKTKSAEPLLPGGSYSWKAINPDGSPVTSHWMFCSKPAPAPVFGVVRHWGPNPIITPLSGDLRDPILKLEPLTDIVAFLPPPIPGIGYARAELGHRGWLVLSSVVTPSCVGVLVEDPVLHTNIAVGGDQIAISAVSQRTLQTIGLEALQYVECGDAALFVKRIVQ